MTDIIKNPAGQSVIVRERMKFVDQSDKPLFHAEGIFKVGERIGYNFDNDPTHYAVMDILSIKDDKAVLSDPRLVIKND